MTGFKSKKAAALDEEGMYLVHHTAQAEQCSYPDCKCPTENPCLKGLAQPAQEPQRPWVGLEGKKIRYLWEEATKPDRSTMAIVTSFAQAIDAALRIKNT